MRFDECHGLLVLHISRMKEETRVRVAVVTVVASDFLVFGEQTSNFVLAGMAFAATLGFEVAFAGEEEDANRFAFAAATSTTSTTSVIVTIDTIGTSAPWTVFTQLHFRLVLASGLEKHTTVVVHVILATSHDERMISSNCRKGKKEKR